MARAYKLSINVGKKYKFVRKIETDMASTHDSQHFDNVFDTSNTSRDVYADRGYPSDGRAAWLRENGFRNQIQRKGKRNKPLSERQQQWHNHHIAKTRARRAHVRGDRADERKGDPHGRRSAGELRDDNDGGLLQPEAVGVFAQGRNRSFLTPVVGRIADAQGDSKQNRGDNACESGDSSRKLNRIR